ncbi:MAG: pantoate--beta-alanine ligase [Chitinophagaceae bacterium]|nr:pantoate--beta-alanine ligase [Chitinophagaceae bacterium]MBP7108528.1 pantoate--beta-alanine ligase [Chitinophagaceae bacterium]HQX95760.1 pantoate--beta-alanine ligase [Chitinophagaceae bacterium]HRA11661.1 pantoate--beta-alanine ligase [Chitinophagaceae bacterium]
MILFKKAMALQNWLDKQRKSGLKLGFVPTMGALHDGHISLIHSSKKVNDITVCSIFVNPTQFNNTIDFDKYPSTIEQDIPKLEDAGCDVLFLPSVEEIYPSGLTIEKTYDLGNLEAILEGEFRPGHYQGVCMVVDRLLNIVGPDNLYLGEKDFQQCMVITKLIELIGLKEKIAITICPTLRQTDGLAMSSRNMRLNENERSRSALIFETLLFIKNNAGKSTPFALKKEAARMLEEAGFKVDYVEIADSSTLTSIKDWVESKKVVALIAAYNNEIRLIDNMLLFN